jgi:acyl carrier protein
MNGTPHPRVLGREEIVSVIADALERMFGRPLHSATSQTRLFEEVGLDSTRVLELLLELEDGLGIEFDADDLEQGHFQTLGTLADYVLEQVGA